MASDELSVNPSEEKTESKGSFSDFDVKAFLLYLWHKKIWIILCFLLFVGYSYYKFKQQPRVYGSEAQVMFVFGDESGSTGGGSGLSSLVEIKNSGYVNLNNELAVLRSPALMEKVVEKLNLTTSYSTPKFSYRENLYGRSPVDIYFYDVTADSTASFVLRKEDKNHVIAYDFRLQGREIESPALRIPLNCVAETPVGQIAILPTANFDNFPAELFVDKNTLVSVATGLAGGIQTINNDGNTVITIKLNDTNQQLATDVIDGLIDAYTELWTYEKRKSANATSEFINDRIVKLEQELSGIDQSIAGKKKGTGSTFEDIYTPIGDQKNDAAYEIRTNLAVAENNKDRIAAALSQNRAISVPSGNSSVDALIKDYNDLLTKRNKVADGAGENNPVLKEYNDNLDLLRSSILSGVNSQIADYRLQASRVSSLGASYKSRGYEIPEKEAEMLPVERQQKVKESLYLYLLQKREENELTKMISVNNTRVIQPAHTIGIVAPNLTEALSKDGAVGILIPIAILFLFFRFNTKVNSRSDIEGLTVPFLGEIPLSIKGKKKGFSLSTIINPGSRKADDKNLEIVVKERSRSYINEAFRMIRTNLDFMTKGRDKSQVLMVTSFEPGSGKTFISMNLAVSLALKGKKVVVVDVDLRRTSLSKYAGNAPQGVSAYLTGKSPNVRDLVVAEKSHGYIDVLPVGAVPPNPVELLLSEDFDNLIKDLREIYDYVVLDCPPYDLVADTSIISRVADASIFVVRVGVFNKAAIPEIEELYHSGKLSNMSLILNGVDVKKTYYNHRYGYKNSSGYYINDSDDKD